MPTFTAMSEPNEDKIPEYLRMRPKCRYLKSKLLGTLCGCGQDGSHSPGQCCSSLPQVSLLGCFLITSPGQLNPNFKALQVIQMESELRNAALAQIRIIRIAFYFVSHLKLCTHVN